VLDVQLVVLAVAGSGPAFALNRNNIEFLILQSPFYDVIYCVVTVN